MTGELYSLYKENFPEIVRRDDVVMAVFDNPDNHIIYHDSNSRLSGFSVIGDNTIYLLCVDKPSQNKGIGSILLKQSEDFIESTGFNKVILGAGKTYIMPGVPMNRGVQNFFEKRGYCGEFL